MSEPQVKLKDLINNLSISIFRFSLDADGRFLFVNSDFGRMLGRQDQDLLKMDFKGIVENPDDFSRFVAKIHSDGHVRGERIKLKRKDGSHVQCSINAVLAKNEKAKGLIVDGTAEDITEPAKIREDLLQGKIAAEEASNAKTMFLANMSHEVRTPLNAVIAILDLTLETDLTEDQRDNLMTAKEAADNLLNLLNDILDISRVESGKIKLENTEFDLWKVIESLTRGFSVLANKKNIKLTSQIHPRVPHLVVGDPARLRQIIVNLINNAIKFTHEGKIEIAINADSVFEGEAKLTFSVSDTGIGIAQDKQGWILGVFTQADPSITRKYGGTGLGLAICKRLTEMMGGRIWVKSEEGVGSIFYFTAHFKINSGTSTQVSSREKNLKVSARRNEAPQGLRILNILLAEDNLLNQKIMAKLLEKRGWIVTIAENGQDVLNRISEKNFDAILMDVQMPILDGLEATRMIRRKEEKAGGHIPIVAI
ncbi:MAG: ATP-binding protein, partial [Candidatus Omnitrophica bacterium]|nr:ATP-binding protein [Candidatus Omnitrophota bacterium]